MCVFYLPQLPHNLLAVLLLAHARFLKNNFCLLDAMLPFYLYFPHHYYTFDTVDSLTPTSIVPPTFTHSHTHTTHTHNFNVFFPSFDDGTSVGSHSTSFANSDFPYIHLPTGFNSSCYGTQTCLPSH